MTIDYRSGSIVSLGAVALVLMGAGCMPSQPAADTMMENNPDAMMEDMSGDTMLRGDAMKNDDNMVGGDAMMDDDTMMEKEDDRMMEQSSAGTFEAYSADKLSRASDGTVVLAFLADWCPTCRAFKTNTRANMSDIPAGLSILEVNYDDATALRQKYGVTTQHTFVEVDASGMMLQKWTGGNTLDSVTERVS